jgi:hypothetical protein
VTTHESHIEVLFILESRLDLNAVTVAYDPLHGFNLRAKLIEDSGMYAGFTDNLQSDDLSCNPVFGAINGAEPARTKLPTDDETVNT